MADRDHAINYRLIHELLVMGGLARPANHFGRGLVVVCWFFAGLGGVLLIGATGLWLRGAYAPETVLAIEGGGCACYVP